MSLAAVLAEGMRQGWPDPVTVKRTWTWGLLVEMAEQLGGYEGTSPPAPPLQGRGDGGASPTLQGWENPHESERGEAIKHLLTSDSIPPLDIEHLQSLGIYGEYTVG